MKGILPSDPGHTPHITSINLWALEYLSPSLCPASLVGSSRSSHRTAQRTCVYASMHTRTCPQAPSSPAAAPGTATFSDLPPRLLGTLQCTSEFLDMPEKCPPLVNVITRLTTQVLLPSLGCFSVIAAGPVLDWLSLRVPARVCYRASPARATRSLAKSGIS